MTRLITAVLSHQSQTGRHINICRYFVFQTRISPQGERLGEDVNAATVSVMLTTTLCFKTRSSAIAERPHNTSCRWIFC